MTATLAAGMALLAPLAFAQSFDAVRLYGAVPGKSGGSFGAALVAGHQYAGSDVRRTLVIPLLDYQWANGWFAGFANGLGYNFSGSAPTQYGLRLTADRGRKDSLAPALRGMGDIGPAAEVGAFVNHALPGGVFLTSSLRYGAGQGHGGLVVDLGAGYLAELAPAWRLAVGAGLTLANASHMQSFFGVTAAQAAASGHAVARPGAGLRDARANLALTCAIEQKTSLPAALSVSSLLGHARDSPLTRQRSAETLVLAINHAF